MSICDDCIEYEIPECVEFLNLEFSGIDSGTEYLVQIENHFGDKQVLTIETFYSSLITIDVADLPDGYFFRDNTYELKIFENEEARQCDTPLNLCGYETCIILKVKKITGADNQNITLECCT